MRTKWTYIYDAKPGYETHPGAVRVVHRAVPADDQLGQPRLQLQLLVQALPALARAPAMIVVGLLFRK